MTYDAVPLIRRATLFGHPERTNPELSPDGTRLGFLAPENGVLQVWEGPVEGPWKPLTRDRDSENVRQSGRGIAAFGFCHDDRTLLYIQDEDGDENWRVYTLDLTTPDAAPRCITPYNVQAKLLGHNRRRPHTVMLGLNLTNPQLHDVYRYDLSTGVLEEVARNPGFASWLLDADLEVRGGTAMTPDGGAVLHLREASSGEFRPWREIPSEEVAGTNVLGFTGDGHTLLMLSTRDANTARLVAVDVRTGTSTVLAEDPSWDISRVELDPETLVPQGVVYAKDRDSWTWLDAEMGERVASLRKTLRVDGELNIGRTSGGGRRWLVSVMPSDGPLEYYVHDLSSGSTSFVFSYGKKLGESPLSRMEPVVLSARDGIELHGYLTFPLGVPRRDLPTVLLVHGGPWARDVWGFNPDVQWLANRGYLCVQVNFRGSKGYGKAFAALGDKEWGHRMLDDLVDTVSFCVGQGFSDPSRVGVMGSSFGGYLSLAGAAFTPDVFACAVDLCGPSNLLTLLESIPSYWKPMISYMHAKVGDPATERDMLWARSPLSKADAIQCPVLIGQGANDPRVPQAEAEQIVSALARNGLPYEYLLFADEGHGLVRPENRERFYATAERFLAEHLGGRCE